MTSTGRSGIATAMICVAFVAGGFVLLRYPSPISSMVLWTAVLTALLIISLVAFLDPRRSFWIGFAVFGVGYTLIFLSFNGSSRVNLMLTRELVQWYLDGPGHSHYGTFNLYQSFDSIFHALAAILHGVGGGLLAVWLRPRLRKAGANGP